MRRPPDKESHPVLSDRDVESSNATLNTVFKGSRLKSWMIGAGTPVRPTPRRPSTSNGSALLTTSTSQRTSNVVLPSPAPSDESSPTLAQSPTHGTRLRNMQDPVKNDTRVSQNINKNDITARPQDPSPSTLGRMKNDVQNMTEQIEQQEIANRAREAEPPRVANGELAIAGDVLTQPNPSELLMDVTSQAQYPHSRLQTVPGPSTASSLLTPHSVTETQGQISAQNYQHWQHTDQLASSVQALASSPMATCNLTVQPSTHFNQAQTDASRLGYGPVLARPSNRQRTQAPIIPSLKSCIHMIDDYILSVGGSIKIDPLLEGPRFQLLKDACEQQDPFYLVLHQVFCLWDLDQSLVTSIHGFPKPQVLQKAFATLGLLIRDNGAMDTYHKQWFSKFPNHIPALLRDSGSYRTIASDIGVFLGKLTLDWTIFSVECLQRKFPPLVDELVRRMWILSPVLQGVVFTASIRNLIVEDNSTRDELEILFRRDRYFHQQLSAPKNSPHSPIAVKASEHNRLLTREYIDMVDASIHRQRTAFAASLRAPAPLRGRSIAQTAPSPVIRQPLSSTSQNFQLTRCPNNNFPAYLQHGQQNAISTGLPPNAATVIAGSPSTFNGHLSPYTISSAQTPSPTIFHNLTTQSPLQKNIQNSPVSRIIETPTNSNVTGQGLGVLHPNGSVFQVPESHTRHQRNSQHQHPIANIRKQNNSDQLTQLQLPLYVQPREINSQRQRMQTQPTFGHLNVANFGNHQHVITRNNSISSNTNCPPTTHSSPTSPRTSRASLPGEPLLSTEIQQIYTYNQAHPITRPIVPPHRYSHPSQAINPDMTALHQAYIRSPRLIPMDIFPAAMPLDDKSRRFYQAVAGFVTGPWRINPATPISKYEFAVSEQCFVSIAPGQVFGIGQLEDRKFTRGTLQYRIRCVRRPKEALKCDAPDFAVSDTVWPDNTVLKLNDHYLELRRKNHHSKDLPIDITSYVRAAGPAFKHRIILSIAGRRLKMKESSFFFAIETVEIFNHQQILDMAQCQCKPAEQTLDSIKKSLTLDDEDEDISMVTSELSIDLADPFTARSFEIPARGGGCLHRECFDLETFLLTRNSKPKRFGKGEPCMVDVWKCPLCGQDARPSTLVIDNFLVGVRADLIDQGDEHVKSILIGKDGKWRPKEETRSRKRNAISDTDSEDNNKRDKKLKTATRGHADQTKSSMEQEVEIIEIDDD